MNHHPNLAPFVVDGRLCGRLLGTGSYGSVEEVNQSLAQYDASLDRSAGPAVCSECCMHLIIGSCMIEKLGMRLEVKQ